MKTPNTDNSSSEISRRELLRRGTVAFGAITAMAATAPLAHASQQGSVPEEIFDDVDSLFAGSCPLTPPDVEGPFWLDLAFLRGDISEGLAGFPLTVYLKIIDGATCSPISGAVADLWHDSPLGKYSGFASQGTLGETYLRGIQVTNPDGIVRFDTVFPGWYPGRTPHMHLKMNPSASAELTTQLYFEDNVSAKVYQNVAPYDARGASPTTNANDGFFNSQLLMSSKVRGGRLIVGKRIVIT